VTPGAQASVARDGAALRGGAGGQSVRGIVFDLDGTLVDSLADIAQAMNRAFAELSLPPVTAEQVRPAMGNGALELVRESVRAVAPDRTGDAFVTAVCRLYTGAYAADPTPFTRLYADAGAALPALHDAGVALGICTNKTTELAWRVLRAVGLDGVVTVVRGRDATRHPKPDPRHLLEAVAELGLSAAEIVYVGDNPVDLAVGRGAGVRYRHVAWGEPVPDDVARVERFAELCPGRRAPAG
jgi:phosphoglycolate phosphatase